MSTKAVGGVKKHYPLIARLLLFCLSTYILQCKPTMTDVLKHACPWSWCSQPLRQQMNVCLYCKKQPGVQQAWSRTQCIDASVDDRPKIIKLTNVVKWKQNRTYILVHSQFKLKLNERHNIFKVRTSPKTNHCFRFPRVLKEFEHRSKFEMFECFQFLNGWRNVSMATEKWRWYYEICFCFSQYLFNDSVSFKCFYTVSTLV